MNTQVIVFLLIILFIIACFHFIKNNDELPLILVIFNLLVLTRLFALEAGDVDWVAFDYGIIFDFDMEQAYIVSQLIFLGTAVLFISYLIFYKKREQAPVDKAAYFEEFLDKNKNIIIAGFVFFYLFKMATGNSLGDTLGKGYGFLLTLANSAFIILLFLVFYKLKTNILRKSIFGVLFFIVSMSTYSPGLRYQFLGWAIPIFVYLFRNLTPGKKIGYYSIGIVVTFIFFSMAGVAREEENFNKSLSENIDSGIDRILVAEDVNFIDGFVMLHQIYPQYLDFHLGTDHLGILLRPVPRAWWPGKPEGAWQQKYAQKYNLGYNFVTGISPTLYGVFYGEGGAIAIVIFSILWAFIFNKIRSKTEYYDRDLQYILKGIFLASLLPLLRSGDLPGDISIIGMSYWPIFIFIYRYNKFIKEKKEEEKLLALVK
jgi:hypothetical protein